MKSKGLVIAVCATLIMWGSMLSVNPVKAPTIYETYAGNPGKWGIPPSFTSSLTPIQDAVTAAGAGDTILVHPDPNGVYPYSEYVTIDDTKNGLTLRGDGAGVTILDGTGLPIPWPSPSGIRIVKADYITVEGFTIRHYAYWTAFGYGIEIGGAEPDYATNNIIRNNIIESCGSGIGMGVASSNTIENNIIQNNHYWWGGGLGVFVDNGYGNQIKDNQIHNNGWTGIELHIAGHTQVLNNVVDGSGIGWGLYADGYSGYLTIYNNTFRNNGYGGLTSWGIYGGGIFVISGANNIADNTANKNKGDGIFIFQGGGNWVHNNTANFNGRYGIAVGIGYVDWQSNWNTIEFNTFNKNGLGGIFVNASDWNTIQYNTANWNGWPYPPGPTVDGFGILIEAGDHNTIRYNTANKNYRYGIAIRQGWVIGHSPPGTGSWDPAEYNTITHNTAKLTSPYPANSYDLYWDGNGLGNTWSTTSSVPNDNSYGTKTSNIP